MEEEREEEEEKEKEKLVVLQFGVRKSSNAF